MRPIMLVTLALALAACSLPSRDTNYAPPVNAPTVNAPRTTLVPPVQNTPVPTPAPTPTPFVVDKVGLQDEIAAQTNANWQRTGVAGRVTLVLCVPDTDALHLSCSLRITGSPYFSAFIVKATCDTDGSCIWRPE